MDKYLTVDEFIEVITKSLKGTLDRDFGASRCHIVDLMTHATTGMEWMYQFVDAYGAVDYERHLQAKAPVGDIQPVVKKDKKAK
jgi:hypothetical protein